MGGRGGVWILLLALAVAPAVPAGPAADATVAVRGARLWAAPDNTRLVLDLSGPAEHRVFTLTDPPRVVVDIERARLAARLDGLDLSRGYVRRVRHGRRANGDLRVVLDLRRAARPKSFLLRPSGQYGHRLVVDLYDAARRKGPVKTVEQAAAGRPRDVIVAIDAGHGGEDPGARGPRGTREKDVVLAIARRLARHVNAEPGMRAVLIRTGDYYVGLRERMARARRHRADLFLSIHADAFRDRRARGASVYVLSRRGASTEAARWLAERENASDLVGGVSLDDKDELLASVLLDLSQSATIEASIDAARSILRELGRVGRLHRRRVEQAGFVVLKSPDIPSVLVETAFISNPREERLLRSPRHQERVARAILRGIKRYFATHAPPGTLLASRRHVIARGDTLIAIARRYNVSVEALRRANGLRGDRLRVGRVLRIPAASES